MCSLESDILWHGRNPQGLLEEIQSVHLQGRKLSNWKGSEKEQATSRYLKIIFRNVMLCNGEAIHKQFWGLCLHLQDRKVLEASNRLLLNYWSRSVASQTKKLFTVAAVGTSNPAKQNSACLQSGYSVGILRISFEIGVLRNVSMLLSDYIVPQKTALTIFAAVGIWNPRY